VDLLAANQATPEFERVMIIKGVVTKTEQTLKELLIIFGRIQDSVAERPSVWEVDSA
jgi:hypothetical protein